MAVVFVCADVQLIAMLSSEVALALLYYAGVSVSTAVTATPCSTCQEAGMQVWLNYSDSPALPQGSNVSLSWLCLFSN